jgi:hypothetical protein
VSSVHEYFEEWWELVRCVESKGKNGAKWGDEEGYVFLVI